MPLVPFGEYMPDQPPYLNPGSSNITNVLPLTPQSYGPVPSLAAYTNALLTTCMGGTFMRDSAANVHGFSGTATNLYHLSGSGGTTWANVSRVLAVPSQSALATSASGGTLAANTYYYVITALTANGETTKSNEQSITTTGTTSSNTVTWGAVTNATGYRIYRGTAAGAENVYYAVGAVTTYTDTNAASTNGAPPVSNTATVSYNVANDQTWQFAAMDQRVIATQIGDVIQTYLVGTDTAFSQLSAAAPQARYVAVVKNFCMVANTTDPVNNGRPQRVWWSALGDATSWPTPGTTAAAQVQSDYQDLLGDGGWNQGIIGGLAGADVAIFQERRIWRGVYVGSPAIFSFAVADAARGTPCPGSIVQAGGVAYYLADQGFFAFDGVQSMPIGDQKVDKTFWADVDTNFLYRVSAAVDPLTKLIFWAYPGAGNNGGTPNKILVYHYGIQRWANIDQISVEYLARGMTVGYTLDQLYTQLGYTIDKLPYPLDSRVWTGGRLTLGAFDTSHKFGFFSGSNIACTLETSEATLNDEGMSFVNRVWPMVDTAAAQVSIGYRNRLADNPAFTSPTGISATTGSAGVRATGMYLRGRLTIPAATIWSHAQGIQFDARKAGRR